MTYHLQHRLYINSPWLCTGAPYHESKRDMAIDKCQELGANYRVVDSENKQVYPKEE
jgi:hypothetical protein